MRSSVQPGDWIFVKVYAFLSFAKNMFKNIGKNISKSLSSKCSQKPLYHTKKSEQFREKIKSNRIKK